MEGTYEEDGHHGPENGWCSEIPHQVRISDHSRDGQIYNVCQANREEKVYCGEEATHIWTSSRVGNSVCCRSSVLQDMD